jgi:hypothetical protein
VYPEDDAAGIQNIGELLRDLMAAAAVTGSDPPA